MRIAVFVCGFLLVSEVSRAQTSQIEGTIRDSAGLAIPGAEVKVTQTATGVVRTALSGGEGGYVIPTWICT